MTVCGSNKSSLCCGSLDWQSENYDSKMTPVGLLDAEKLALAVLLLYHEDIAIFKSSPSFLFFVKRKISVNQTLMGKHYLTQGQFMSRTFGVFYCICKHNCDVFMYDSLDCLICFDMNHTIVDV